MNKAISQQSSSFKIESPHKIDSAVEKRIEWVDAKIKEKQVAIKTAPTDRIIASNQRGTAHYYLMTEQENSGNKQRTYLPRSREDFAAKLIQRDYDKKVLSSLQAERKLLEQYLSFACSSSAETVYPNTAESRRRLISPVESPIDEYVNNWIEARKPSTPLNFAGLKTVRGEFVRSKSEVIIANTLFENEIPYHYEINIKLNTGRMVNPDFIILNKRTRKEMIWEHFGMMDDDNYLSKAVPKIRLYAESGYHLGIELIATFENSTTKLDSAIVQDIIATYCV